MYYVLCTMYYVHSTMFYVQGTVYMCTCSTLYLYDVHIVLCTLYDVPVRGRVSTGIVLVPGTDVQGTQYIVLCTMYEYYVQVHRTIDID